jgi:hypothetical protein
VLRALTAAFLLLGVAGASPAASPTSAPPLSDPDAIFVAARKAWGSGAYPRYAVYAVVVTFRNGTNVVRRTWETTEDLRGAIVYSHTFSREELANPYTPHGINIQIPLIPDLNREKPSDPVGQVEFAVDQDYGLAPGTRKFSAAKSGTAVSGDSSHLPVIGRTATVNRDYEVKLVETLTDAKGREYHLTLRPLRDPDHHRLRELWVDGTTMLPEEAVVAGIGSRPPLTKVNWRVEFAHVQGGTYIARETALGPVDYGEDGMLTECIISFEELTLTSRFQSSGFGIVNGNPQSDP